MSELKSELRGALARGYCHKETGHLGLDSVLIEAMVEELLMLNIVTKPIEAVKHFRQMERDGKLQLGTDNKAMLDEAINEARP